MKKKRRTITLDCLAWYPTGALHSFNHTIKPHYSHVRNGLCIVHRDGFFAVTHIKSFKTLGRYGYSETLKDAKRGLQIAESLASKYNFSWQYTQDKILALAKKNKKLYDELRSKSLT